MPDGEQQREYTVDGLEHDHRAGRVNADPVSGIDGFALVARALQFCGYDDRFQER